MSEWIKVSDKLPASSDRYLVIIDFHREDDAYYWGSFYHCVWFWKGRFCIGHLPADYVVTHWMPLPEPPQD